MDLFEKSEQNKHEPLAARMRPRNLDEYIGQDHIVGKGRLLRRAIAADRLSSVIFYGPPGTGKTTLARVIANHTQSNFVSLNAVLSGVSNIRDAIKNAEEQKNLYSRKTILFVDEVHRWNKSQQDALLPWVENGTVILVGATTENPFFEVNKALVSRSRIFQLVPLTIHDLEQVAHATLINKERGYGRWNVQFELGALEHLVATAKGDARSLLNALELAVETTPEQWSPHTTPCIPPEQSLIYITKHIAEESIQESAVLYDKDGDYHYDVISAFIKSIRGSDPDATLYWLARMVAAGENARFIFRRMLISACEDIGLAEPHAIGVIESCAAAFDRVGLPEGRFMLTQAALYLATCPKSNTTLSFFDALQTVSNENADIPPHLKDGNRDKEGFGHGKGYLYPHAFKDHWTEQQYLPTALKGRIFYNPSDQGYEKKIQSEVYRRRELQLAAMLSVDPVEENLTFSPKTDDKINVERFWQKRTEIQQSTLLRDYTLSQTKLLRHHRSLIINADDGLLLWEVWRQSPEGFVAGVCKKEENINVLLHYAQNLERLECPKLTTAFTEVIDIPFDKIFFNNPVVRNDDIPQFLNQLHKILACAEKNATIIIVQKIPTHAHGLSFFLKKQLNNYSTDDIKVIEQAFLAEKKFYTNKENPLFAWDEQSLKAAIEQSLGIADISMHTKTFIEHKKMYPEILQKYFNKKTSEYGAYLHKSIGEQSVHRLQQLLFAYSEHTIFAYESVFSFFSFQVLK